MESDVIIFVVWEKKKKNSLLRLEEAGVVVRRQGEQ